MTLTSVRIPFPLLELLQDLVNMHYYVNISEAIRTAIRDFIKVEHIRMKDEDAKKYREKLGFI